jgi:glutaminase
MPAKSGVSGGVLAVLPGQLGLGVFSPPLDARGNSVRGVEVCRRLARDLDLHVLSAARPSGSIVRASYSLARVGSKRVRREQERDVLDRVGSRARVWELHGDLGFAAVEAVTRRIVERGEELDIAVVDLGRVTQIGDAAAELLYGLFQALARAGKELVLARTETHARVVRSLEERGLRDGGARVLSFAELDRALEFCENRLLGLTEAERAVPRVVPLAEHEALRGLSKDELRELETRLERKSYAPGQVIVRRGETADRLFILTRGEVSVTAELPNGQQKRLSTLSAGSIFGELAALTRTPRSADVRADRETECFELALAQLEALGDKFPPIKATLLENLLRGLARTATRLTDEVLELSR